jgi:hypothetical protein
MLIGGIQSKSTNTGILIFQIRNKKFSEIWSENPYCVLLQSSKHRGQMRIGEMRHQQDKHRSYSLKLYSQKRCRQGESHYFWCVFMYAPVFVTKASSFEGDQMFFQTPCLASEIYTERTTVKSFLSLS